jgi:hypothetical protein
MADSASVASIGYAEGGDGRTAALQKKRETIVMVRWALIIACAYFILFSDTRHAPQVPGLLIIAAFLASNLWLGRLPVERVAGQQFNVGIAALDSVFIAASLYFAGQLSVELLVLCLGILTLAIAGLRLGTIAAVTMGMTVVYVAMVGAAGVEPLWRSSTLLRVPFLLGAALLYASLVEGGRQGRSSDAATTSLKTDLASQAQAIGRCQAALASGSEAGLRAALEEVSACNRQMCAKVDGSDQASGMPAPSPAAQNAA